MKCILDERECTDCRECKICDLSPDKDCDNCCECINAEKEYNELIADIDENLREAFKGKD